MEADLRMASNWGRNSRALAVEGRSIAGTPNPNGLPEPNECGDGLALNIAMTVDGDNNGFTLPCAVQGGLQANTDSFTVRRVTVAPAAPQAGRLQIQTTRIQGSLFADGNVPAGFSPVDSTTHSLLVNTYYVSADSSLIPGVPTLRRKSLGIIGGGPGIIDQEIAPGVENMQIQLGIDVDEDNTVDRYVNPGDEVYDPAAAGFIPGARVLTARVWLVVRGITQEIGIQQVRGFQPGDINLGVPNDAFRRIQVSKTILLRNSRT